MFSACCLSCWLVEYCQGACSRPKARRDVGRFTEGGEGWGSWGEDWAGEWVGAGYGLCLYRTASKGRIIGSAPDNSLSLDLCLFISLSCSLSLYLSLFLSVSLSLSLSVCPLCIILVCVVFFMCVCVSLPAQRSACQDSPGQCLWPVEARLSMWKPHRGSLLITTHYS